MEIYQHSARAPTRRNILGGMASFLTAAIVLPTASVASAQSAFPERPLRLIAPFSAGGAADTVARIITPKLSLSLGQPVVVENRAGASGAIGSAAVANASPDGYTLLINLGPPHQTVNLFTKSVKFDPITDFTPIRMIAVAPQALVVPASSKLKTVRDLVTAAKSSPKGLTYATSGIGTSQHLAGLLLAESQKISLTHIGYRGGAPALTDVIAGQVDSGILVLSNSLPFIKDGKVRALGVVESHRSKAAPDIPTLSEGGLAGFSVPDTWVGVLGPKNLPAPVLDRLSNALARVIADEEVRAALSEAGYDPVDNTPKDFDLQLRKSAAIYREIMKRSGIEPE